MNAHPYADRFPMLGAEELDRLAADIAENGLQHPIILDEDGRILDGRNRWAACEIAGFTPETRLYDGDDPAAFVLSANVSRRHMTTGQQAMSTALVLVDAGKRENGRWKRGSLPTLDSTESRNTWQAAMTQAGVILDHAPELAEHVVNGEAALDKAFQEAERVRDAVRQRMEREERERIEEAEARTFIEHHSPDLAAQVGDVFQSYAEAQAVWEKRNREEAERIAAQKAKEAAEAKALRDSYTDLYSGIAQAIGTIGGKGENASFETVWGEFSPIYLHPPQLERYLTVEKLRSAAEFINNLIEWKETQ